MLKVPDAVLLISEPPPVKRNPLFHVAVPALIRLRPVRIRVLPPRDNPPLALIAPAPPSVPPFHVVEPLTLMGSLPATVPPETVSCPAEIGFPVLKFATPFVMLRAPPLENDPVKLFVPPPIDTLPPAVK